MIFKTTATGDDITDFAIRVLDDIVGYDIDAEDYFEKEDAIRELLGSMFGLENLDGREHKYVISEVM